MTDLVQRLRSLARHTHDDASVGDEAADEIERLRAELNGMRHEADAWRATARDKGDVSRRNLERDTALMRQALGLLEEIDPAWGVDVVVALRERLKEKP